METQHLQRFRAVLPQGSLRERSTPPRRELMSKTATANHSTRARAPRTRRWTCAGCEVTVRYAAGSPSTPRRPEGWTKAGGQGALPARPGREGRQEGDHRREGDGWASRRQALLEFELKRSP